MGDEKEKEFEITTTAQVERTYRVKGTDEDQAHQRLRVHIKDPSALREGLVTELPDRQIDSTPQKVKEKHEVTKPRAVPEPEAEPKPTNKDKAAAAAGGAK